MFRQNSAAYVHELTGTAVSNVDGESAYVRVQVLSNAGALDRDTQLAMVSRLTDVVAAAPGRPPQPDHVWVLLTEAVDGGWGLWGHAHTNAELVDEQHGGVDIDGELPRASLWVIYPACGYLV